MYDDIATNELNPTHGVIINHLEGEDLYAGVPKTLIYFYEPIELEQYQLIEGKVTLSQSQGNHRNLNIELVYVWILLPCGDEAGPTKPICLSQDEIKPCTIGIGGKSELLTSL
ncbi:hypothetical protein AAZX31_18G153800 [Glycine max]